MTFSDPEQVNYATVAKEYARFRPGYPAALFQELVRRVPARSVALDCACGSGQATRSLAAYFNKVIGADISEAQLDQARKHTDQPNVTYVHSPAEDAWLKANLSAKSVDLITVATAFHWLAKDRFLRSSAEALKEGGILAHWTYTSSVLTVREPHLRAVVDGFIEEIKPFWPEKHFGSARESEGLSDDISPLFVQETAPKITMRVQRNLSDFLGYCGTFSAIPPYRAARGVDPVADLAERLTPVWGDPQAPRTAEQNLYLTILRRRGPQGMAL